MTKHRTSRPTFPRRGAGAHRPESVVARIAAALALTTGRAR